MNIFQCGTHFFNYQRMNAKKNTLRNYEYILGKFQEHFMDTSNTKRTSRLARVSRKEIRSACNGLLSTVKISRAAKALAMPLKACLVRRNRCRHDRGRYGAPAPAEDLGASMAKMLPKMKWAFKMEKGK